MEPTSSFYPDSPIPAVAGSYGSFLRRFAALVIDVMILGVVLGIIGSMLGLSMMGGIGSNPNPIALMGAMGGFWLLWTVASWLYFAYFESSARQGTLGKQVMGLIVTDEQGQRISFTQASIRYVGCIVSGMILYIGYLMQPFTAKKQALHDIIAKTLVWKKAA